MTGLSVLLLGIGVIGMVALPISWTTRRKGRLRSAITVLAAMLSIGLGARRIRRCCCGSPVAGRSRFATRSWKMR